MCYVSHQVEECGVSVPSSGRMRCERGRLRVGVKAVAAERAATGDGNAMLLSLYFFFWELGLFLFFLFVFLMHT